MNKFQARFIESVLKKAIDGIEKKQVFLLKNIHFLYKPWFAQVTWQMVSCDIITLRQQ